MSAQSRTAEIDVGPYEDGSGYAATVKAWLLNGEPVFRVEMRYTLPASEWRNLRKAVEDVLYLVTREVQ